MLSAKKFGYIVQKNNLIMKTYLFLIAFLGSCYISFAQNWQTSTGNYSTGNLGVGINYIPTNYKLHVEGKLFTQQLQIGYSGIAGQVLTLDALGNAVWVTPVLPSWILTGTGNYSTGNLGIGINYVPTNYRLHVEGKLFTQQLQIGYSGITGQVLTVDASGNAVWTTPVSTGWSLGGNALTSPSQFIGSTNGLYPLTIAANNDTRISMPVMNNNQHTVTVGATSRNPYYYQFEVNGGKTALIGPNSTDQSNILQIVSGYNNPNFLTGTIHYMSFSHERFSNNEEHGVINAFQYTNPSGPGIAKQLILQKNSGNVGIGNFTSAPIEKLEVNGNIKAYGDIIFNGNMRLSQLINSSGLWLSNNTTNIYSNASIAIGRVSVPAGYIAAFEGRIRARGMRCDQDNWADDVFEKGYKLMSMDSLDTYISTYKHLPGMPTTDEVQKNGIDIAEMNEQLLRKVEENTLYILTLKEENDELKKKMEEIEALLLALNKK